jgi:thiol:disulfide interchange protein DsbD
MAPGALPTGVPASAEVPLKRVKLVVLEAGGPGPAKVGFHVELAAGWHLYWVNPGDAGLAPNVRWALPAGFTAGALRHPVPSRSVQDGLVSHEHKDQVLLTCEIMPPPAGWPGGPWEASAVLEWMACRESCVTGETHVKAAFPPDSAALAEGRSLLAKFGSRFPRPLSGSGLTAGAARADWTGSAWRVEVELAGPRAAEAGDFFVYPVEGFVVDNAGTACRGGKIVCPLIPSRGPGAPPPSAIGGVLVVGGVGYELSAPVAPRPPGTVTVMPGLSDSCLPGHVFIASWR